MTPALAGTIPAQKQRQVQNGVATNDLVVSAYIEGNDRIFPRILDLYVSHGSTIADVTFGKGVFWRNIPRRRYHLLATDLLTGVDCRDLPYQDESVDCV
ncbi:MAG: site-specific DNA-methyltransferase, partial [Gammaproteobacteria bacterium]|nr:site-specific DNA-methyltransferase [Gammaproteobacteria bacterium]